MVDIRESISLLDFSHRSCSEHLKKFYLSENSAYINTLYFLKNNY